MQVIQTALVAPSMARSYAGNASVRELYFSLQNFSREPQIAAENSRLAREFLHAQLQNLPAEASFPHELGAVEGWIDRHTIEVGCRYRAYVEARREGASRRYFSGRAHALHFLSAVAPTKLVDGAWLYRLCAQWCDPALYMLQRIYLEELGDGDPARNHVLLYQQLLAAHECEDLSHLTPEHYRQGAVQLALAHVGDEFLPELLGFNLAYEQLPLHLLITAYELRELGIDPYYFTLHVTIDNSHTGHARKALQALQAQLPAGGVEMFMQRVRRGAALADAGLGSVAIIENFDLEQTLLRVLVDKSRIGQYMHGDFCRVGGRTVSDWLREPQRMGEFLEALQTTGWIRRGERPEQSRFWQLVQGEKARMFGVFSRFELQVLRDWISAGSTAAMQSSRAPSELAARGGYDDRSGNLDRLRRDLAQAKDAVAAMALLLPWLAPDRHYTAAGLFATREFAQRLG